MSDEGLDPVIHVPARLRIVATGPPGRPAGTAWQAGAYALIIVPGCLTLRGNEASFVIQSQEGGRHERRSLAMKDDAGIDEAGGMDVQQARRSSCGRRVSGPDVSWRSGARCCS